jgi:hypothetical protein
MIYQTTLNGIPLTTGDVVCTSDGAYGVRWGDLWRLLGALVPGPIDHVAIYVGPGGRFVESGARGVIAFEMPGPRWDAETLAGERLLVDTLYGVANPLGGRKLARAAEKRVRAAVARYCLAQAASQKPYNLNFFDRDTEDAFYCSQLVYRAYLPHGIDFGTPESLRDLVDDHEDHALPPILAATPVVLPQQIWNLCLEKHLANAAL